MLFRSDIYDFLGEFGPYKGRYVARYPEAWMGDLRERIGEFAAEKLGPVGLQALKRKFEELDLCLVREKKWGWEDSKTWEGNARDAIASDAVSVIIGNALDPAPFGDWLSTLPRIRDTSRHSWLFRGRASDYIDAIRPLLLNSPAAYFIDPYLDPLSDDCENLLLLIFDLIKGSKCYSIELMVRQCAFNKRDVLSPKTWMPDQVRHDGWVTPPPHPSAACCAPAGAAPRPPARASRRPARRPRSRGSP